MSTFDGNTRIRRAVDDPRTDCVLPTPGALSWTKITTTDALSAIGGQHSELVHGDQREVVDGGQTQHLTGDRTIIVRAKRKKTTVGNYHQNIIGPHTVIHHNVQNEIALGVYSKVYGHGYEIDYPDGNARYEYATWSGNIYDFAEQIHDVDHSHTCEAVSTTFALIQLGGAQLTVAGATVPLNLFDLILEAAHGEVHPQHYEHHLLHVEVHGPPDPSIIS